MVVTITSAYGELLGRSELRQLMVDSFKGHNQIYIQISRESEIS